MNATNHAVAACDSPLEKRDDRNSRAFDCSSDMKYGTPLMMGGELVSVVDDSGDTLVVASSQGTQLSGSECGLRPYRIWTGTKWRAGVPRKIRVVIWGQEFFCRKCKTVMEVRKRMPGMRDRHSNTAIDDGSFGHSHHANLFTLRCQYRHDQQDSLCSDSSKSRFSD